MTFYSGTITIPGLINLLANKLLASDHRFSDPYAGLPRYTGTISELGLPIIVGPLVTGVKYIIDEFKAGDNFVIVGGTNVTGCIFTATGTTLYLRNDINHRESWLLS